MEKHICKYCGKEFDTGKKLGGHITRCRMNPNANHVFEKVGAEITKKANFKTYTFLCEVCKKEYSLTLSENAYKKGNYKKTCSIHCASILSAKNADKDIKNAKIKSSMIKINENNIKKKYCLLCNKEIDTKIRKNSKFCSDECKQIHYHDSLSKSLKGKTGGYRYFSGNKSHKKGFFDNIYFDSSWELAFYVYYKEHDLKIKRCDFYRNYVYNSKTYKYYPDFITDEGIIEIKGFLTDKTKCKLEQNPDIKVLYKKDMDKYLSYVIDKYGDMFWEKFYICDSRLVDDVT